MEEFSKHGKIELAGLKAGMSRKTASKYLRLGKLPSNLEKPRSWRTRRQPSPDAGLRTRRLLRSRVRPSLFQRALQLTRLGV